MSFRKNSSQSRFIIPPATKSKSKTDFRWHPHPHSREEAATAQVFLTTGSRKVTGWLLVTRNDRGPVAGSRVREVRGALEEARAVGGDRVFRDREFRQPLAHTM
jgi:hypothetical protein